MIVTLARKEIGGCNDLLRQDKVRDSGHKCDYVNGFARNLFRDLRLKSNKVIFLTVPYTCYQLNDDEYSFSLYRSFNRM